LTEEYCKVTREVETAVNEWAIALPSLPVITTSVNETVEPVVGNDGYIYICIFKDY
jgi:hypothetical protein